MLWMCVIESNYLNNCRCILSVILSWCLGFSLRASKNVIDFCDDLLHSVVHRQLSLSTYFVLIAVIRNSTKSKDLHNYEMSNFV